MTATNEIATEAPSTPTEDKFVGLFGIFPPDANGKNKFFFQKVQAPEVTLEFLKGLVGGNLKGLFHEQGIDAKYKAYSCDKAHKKNLPVNLPAIKTLKALGFSGQSIEDGGITNSNDDFRGPIVIVGYNNKGQCLQFGNAEYMSIRDTMRQQIKKKGNVNKN